MVFTRKERVERVCEDLIGDLKRHYAMNGSDYRMVVFYNNQHLRLRKFADKLNQINIADKYNYTINDLINKIGGIE